MLAGTGLLELGLGEQACLKSKFEPVVLICPNTS